MELLVSVVLMAVSAGTILAAQCLTCGMDADRGAGSRALRPRAADKYNSRT